MAGVHGQDPDLAAAAQGDLAAAINDNPVTVHDLRGGRHRDRDRPGATTEGDNAAFGHCPDHGGRGAASGRAVPDDVVRMGGADSPARSRNVAVATWVPYLRSRGSCED